MINKKLIISLIVIATTLLAYGYINNMEENKKLEIDFLYLDLSACERCQATDKVLDDALDELKEEIDRKNITAISVNKIKITSDEEAKKYNFVRSPTIKINGVDIEEILSGKLEIKDNYCGSCSEVCGKETDCRVFEYWGKTYNSPPTEMIKEAIAKILKLENIKTDADTQSEKKTSGRGCKANSSAKPKKSCCQ